MTASEPGTNTVSSLYDRLTDALTAAFGDNIHFGYWDDDRDRRSIEQATDRLTDLVAERLAPGVGGRLLDVGCGSGRPAVRIAREHEVHVTGISISKHQIQLAGARPEVGESAGQVAFRAADATRLPFPEASFDGAYAIESLVHMADKAAALGHVGRVLRPGARFVVADFFLDGPQTPGEGAEVIAATCELLRFAPLATLEAYRGLLDQAGMKLVEVTDIRANIRRSYTVTSAAFHRALRALLGELGPEHAAAARLFEQFGALPQVGYGLFTAVRL
ncbi:methyltransferase domain-containing protein [Streptacidiphilus sp. 4-A2]|nr:methyltransferase domain-containing protein [Streptacidiphilus sp. 4-A2]